MLHDMVVESCVSQHGRKMDFCHGIPGVVDLIRDYLPLGLELLLPSLFPRARPFTSHQSETLIREAIEYDQPCLLQACIDLQHSTFADPNPAEYILHLHFAMTKPTSTCFKMVWDTIRSAAALHSTERELATVDAVIDLGASGEMKDWALRLYFDKNGVRWGDVSPGDFFSPPCIDDMLVPQSNQISILWRAALARNRSLFSILNGDSAMTVRSVEERPDFVRNVVEAGPWYVKTFLSNFDKRRWERFYDVCSPFLYEASWATDRKAAREVVAYITESLGVPLSLDVAGIIKAGDSEMLEMADGRLKKEDLTVGLSSLEEILGTRGGSFESAKTSDGLKIGFLWRGEEVDHSSDIVPDEEIPCLDVLISYLEGKRKILDGQDVRAVGREDIDEWSGRLRQIVSLLEKSENADVPSLLYRLKKLL